MDHVYTLACWMTGSEMTANELVSRTYLNVDYNSSERDLFTTFRACYLDLFSDDKQYSDSDFYCKKEGCSLTVLHHQNTDIILSVLFSEICELKHLDIAHIIGKPLDTVRLWLFFGRKLLAKASFEHISPLNFVSRYSDAGHYEKTSQGPCFENSERCVAELSGLNSRR